MLYCIYELKKKTTTTKPKNNNTEIDKTILTGHFDVIILISSNDTVATWCYNVSIVSTYMNKNATYR